MSFRNLILTCTTLILLALPLGAEDYDTELIDENLDSLFDEVPDETEEIEDAESIESEVMAAETLTVLQDLSKETGFTFKVNYAFIAGYSPGWGETPWNSDESVADDAKTDFNHGYSQVVGLDMGSSFSLDFQLNPNLRVKQKMGIGFPDYELGVSQFWAGYNLQDFAYLKLGLRDVKWGLRRNFSFTSITSRIPAGSSGGAAYSFELEKPIGVGGLQLLALTRTGYVDGDSVEDLTVGDLGYGFKYNVAMPIADITLGSFYHNDMYFRSFLSVSTTLWGRTEAYSEGLMAMHQKKFNDHVFSANIGFLDQFFNDQFTVNAEYYWNGEKDITYEDDDDELIEVEESPYIYGHNIALNLGYKPTGTKLSMYIRGMFNVNEDTAKIIPGLRLTLMDDLGLFLAIPFAVGDREGTYYRSNYDEKNRPFAITLALRLNGGYKFARYE